MGKILSNRKSDTKFRKTQFRKTQIKRKVFQDDMERMQREAVMHLDIRGAIAQVSRPIYILEDRKDSAEKTEN